MSSFIISDKAINQIVRYIEKLSANNSIRGRVFDCFNINEFVDSEELYYLMLDKLAVKIKEVNIKGTAKRYKDALREMLKVHKQS